MTKPLTFEEKMNKIKAINKKLENGDVSFQQNLALYKESTKLYKEVRSELKRGKMTFAKITEDGGKEVPFNRDKNGHDIDQKASLSSASDDIVKDKNPKTSSKFSSSVSSSSNNTSNSDNNSLLF